MQYQLRISEHNKGACGCRDACHDFCILEQFFSAGFRRKVDIPLVLLSGEVRQDNTELVRGRFSETPDLDLNLPH